MQTQRIDTGKVLLEAVKGDTSRQDGKWSNGRSTKIGIQLEHHSLSDGMVEQLKAAMGEEKTRTYELQQL